MVLILRNLVFSRRARDDHGTLIAHGYLRCVSFLHLDAESLFLWEITMLGWALTFLVIALIAGVLGFGVVAGTAASIAKILFVVFLVLFVIGLIMGRRGPVV